MKIKNILLSMFILLLVSIMIVGCSSSSSNNESEENTKEENNANEENETITLKVATYFPNTSQMYTFVTEPWMNKVMEKTDGKVEFDVYPAEQLGKAQDMVNLTKDKVTDIGIFPANYFPDTMPLSNMLAGLPNLSDTSEQGTKAYYELIQQNEEVVETDFTKNGIRPLLIHVSPTYEVWTMDKEIRVPSDLKGLKVRTPGGVANEVFEALGVVPVTVPHPEVYEALEKGVIDALSSNAISAHSNGTIEILKHAVLPHIGTAMNTVNINEDVWQGLPEDVQQAMIEAAQEVIETSGIAYDEDTLRINDEFTEAGGVIVELTQEETDQWNAITDNFTQDWLKKHESDGRPYEDVINHYKKLLEEYK